MAKAVRVIRSAPPSLIFVLVLLALTAPPVGAQCEKTLQTLTANNAKAQSELQMLTGLIDDYQANRTEKTQCRDFARIEKQAFSALRAITEGARTCERLVFDCRSYDLPTSVLDGCDDVIKKRDSMARSVDTIGASKPRSCR